MSVDVETGAYGASRPTAPETALSRRGLVVFTAIFWGCFALVTLAYGWDLFGRSLDTLWRPLTTDLIGAMLGAFTRAGLLAAERRTAAPLYRTRCLGRSRGIGESTVQKIHQKKTNDFLLYKN